MSRFAKGGKSKHLILSAKRKRIGYRKGYNKKHLKQKQEATPRSTHTDDSSAGPSNAKPHYEMKENRRFVNVAFFVKSLQNLNNHGGDGCNFSDMHISGETKKGWNAGIKLSCTMCLTTVVVWMEDPDSELVNSQPPEPPTSAGTTTKKLPLIAETESVGPYLLRHRFRQKCPSNQERKIGSAKRRAVKKNRVPAKKRKVNYRITPAPPPDLSVQQHFMVPRTDNQPHSINPHFMVPPSLSRPLLVPQPNTPYQDWTDNQSHSINAHFMAPPPLSRPLLVPQPNTPYKDWTGNQSHSIDPHFMVPPLSRPLLVPQSNTPHQDLTHNPSHSINQLSINRTHFVKQEMVSPEDAVNPSINRVPTSSTQPAAVQLLFCVEPSHNSNSIPRSVNESATLTAGGDFRNYQTSSMIGLENGQTLVTSENEIIVPEITPAEVLPVNLNLVKEEIEDESSMEVNNIPSVRLVPMSETSLNRSETSFASESSIKTEIPKDSSLVKIRSVIPSTKTYVTESCAKPFTSVSDTLCSNDSAVSSYPTLVIPHTVFQQVIPGSKEDLLRQTAESDNNVPNFK